MRWIAVYTKGVQTMRVMCVLMCMVVGFNIISIIR